MIHTGRWLLAMVAALALVVACTGNRGLKDYKLDLSPATLEAGENELDLLIADAKGRPATDLAVSFDVVHRTMEMPKQLVSASHAGDGHYRCTINIAHAGSWVIIAKVSKGGQRLGQAEFSLEVKH